MAASSLNAIAEHTRHERCVPEYPDQGRMCCVHTVDVTGSIPAAPTSRNSWQIGFLRGGVAASCRLGLIQRVDRGPRCADQGEEAPDMAAEEFTAGE